jgi:AcrR family transcriptional regulator
LTLGRPIGILTATDRSVEGEEVARVTAPSVQVGQTSRDKILDAAESLFAKRGYAGIGLREVAEVVGLGKSSLFHHFRNKPQLYAAVVTRILVRIEERLIRSLAAGGDPVARLERWLDEIVDLLAENPAWARLLLRSLFEDDDLSGELPEEIEGHRTIGRILASVSALLREGMGTGQLRVASVPHVLLTVVGATVFPFASGEFGGEVLGKDIFDPAEVRRRKRELRELLRFGLVVSGER